MPSIVTRDGKPVSPVLDDENAAFAWLLRHQPMSTDWAIQHEGYAVVEAAAELPVIHDGESSEACLAEGLSCSVIDGKCTECGAES
jgi:hypothetical protein